MQKRIVHLILAIIFLTTTITQSMGSVFAIATASDTTNHLSIAANYSRAFASTSAVSESLASSLQSQSTSSASTSSDSKSNKKSADSKSSSASKKESTKAPATSKSVLIQPVQPRNWQSALTDPGSEYPDFSKPLPGQSRTVTVSYDDQGNATTPGHANDEIEYPDNAYPVFIPGVSTQDVKLPINDNGGISGEALENSIAKGTNYIQYTKIMSYVASKDLGGDGKQHWVDIKQVFTGFEKHGWSNDEPAYTKNFKPIAATGTTKLTNLRDNWKVTGIGLGQGEEAGSGLFGINRTFVESTFLPANLPTSATATESNFQWPSATGKPGNADYDGTIGKTTFSNRLKVRLEFTDHATGKPIDVAGFFTVADLDHRDYIEFSKNSKIKNVFVTMNPNPDGTVLKGGTEIDDGSDTDVRIVNNLGNFDYASDGTASLAGGVKLTSTGTTPTKDSFGGTSSDVIKADNTDAWATVVFEKTSSVEYNISDDGIFNVLSTALVPVAFSDPTKEGDGETYNDKWDNDTIDYNTLAILPYRGATIQNPQNSKAKLDTFKPVQKFELSDQVDKNLTVTKDDVTIKNQNDVDMSKNFDISVTDNKVVAAAKPEFLGVGITGDTTAVEKNYAQTYSMDIHATAKKDASGNYIDSKGNPADFSSYDTTDANGKTYTVIPNTSVLSEIKNSSSTNVDHTSNVANGHIVAPKIPQEKATIKQEIKNLTTPDAAWSDTETDGKKGDEIGYRFTVKSTTGDLLNSKIKEITDNAADLDFETGSLSITADGTTVTADEDEFTSSQIATIGTKLAKDKEAVVSYKMKVTTEAEKDVTNIGTLHASNLDETDHKLAANSTVLHLKKLVADATDLHQTLKNVTTATGSTEWTETGTGKVGDEIDYRFAFEANGDSVANTTKLVNAKIAAITMAPAGKLEMKKNSDTAIQIAVNGRTTSVNSAAGFAGEIAVGDVAPGDKIVVTYEMTIIADSDVDIVNIGSLTATGVAKAFNPTILTINKQSNTVSSFWQNIKNEATDSDWIGPKLGAETAEAKTTGKPGDTIGYRFTIAPNVANDAKLLDATIKNIVMDSPADMQIQDYDIANPGKKIMVKYGDQTVYLAGADSLTALNAIALKSPIDNDKNVEVYYRAKISDTAGAQTVTNKGDFSASNLTGDDVESNTATLTIQDQRIAETGTLKQRIKNLKTGEDWQYDDTAKTAETTGRVGDRIAYEFSFKADSGNTTAIENEIVKAIGVQATDKLSAPTNLVVKINDLETPATLEGATEGSYSVKLASGEKIAADKTVTVYLERTVASDAAVGDQYVQSGSTGSGFSTETAFNTAVLNIVAQRNAATAVQTIHNASRTVSDETSVKTSGVKGDLINYQFTINVPAGNDGALLNAKLMEINNNLATPGFNLVPNTLKATINGQPVTPAPSEPAFLNNKNGSVAIASSLINGVDQTIVVSYQMQITADPATDGVDVQNDGNFYADNLTGGTFPAGSTVTDQAHKVPANATHLIINKSHAEITNLKQTISNTTTPANDQNDPTTKVAVETSGSKDDIIQYTFTGETSSTNTEDLKAVAIKNIKMTEANNVDATGKLTYVGKSLNVTVDNTQTVKNGSISGDSVTVGATVKNSFKVTYKMKVVTAEKKTIFNDGDLSAKRLDNTTKAFNQTTLNVTVPQQKVTLKQTILNTTTGETSTDGMTAKGKAGDIIEYHFHVDAPDISKDPNAANLINAALKDIQMNLAANSTDMTLVPYDATATTPGTAGNNIFILMSGMSGNEVYLDGTDFTANHQVIVPKNTWTTDLFDIDIKYKMKVGTPTTDGQVITNDGNLYADNLQGAMPANTPAEITNQDHKMAFNQTVLNIKHKQEVTLEQKLKNEKTDTEYKTETKGAKDDIIDYQFKITAPTDNTADISGMEINNISSLETGKLTFINDADNQDYPITVELQDATGNTVNVVAKFDSTHKIITFVNKDDPNKSVVLPAGKTMTVTYKMRVVADIDDNSTAADKLVTNDAEFKADVLTHAVPAPSGTGTINEKLTDGKMAFPDDTKLNLENGVGKITIRYVDLDEDLSRPDVKVPTTPTDPAGSMIHTPVIATGKIGDPISKGKYADGTPVTPEPADQLTPKIIPGYTITSMTETDPLSISSGWVAAYKDDPVFDNNKNRIITYGYKKRMISIKAPEKWDFGHYYRTQRDITYYLRASQKDVPEEVTVDDQYGVDKWQLQVEQAKPFMDDRKQELTNAELRFKNANITSETKENTGVGLNDNKINTNDILTSKESFELKATKDTPAKVQNLMTYEHVGTFQKEDENGDGYLEEDTSSKDNRYTDPGTGRWHYRFGVSKTADSSIGLFVPESTKRAPSTYRTTLTWSLTVAK